MGYDDDEERADYYLGRGIESLRESEDWSDKKIAKWLRELAKGLDPRRPRRRSIDPLKITPEELIKYPQHIQDQVKRIQQLHKKADDFRKGLANKKEAKQDD